MAAAGGGMVSGDRPMSGLRGSFCSGREGLLGAIVIHEGSSGPGHGGVEG